MYCSNLPNTGGDSWFSQHTVNTSLRPCYLLVTLSHCHTVTLSCCQVCDFGISKMKDATAAASTTRLQPGTPAYMAPEQFEGVPVSEKVDVFAFGVLLWECMARQQPWKDLSAMQIIYAVGLQVCACMQQPHCYSISLATHTRCSRMIENLWPMSLTTCAMSCWCLLRWQ